MAKPYTCSLKFLVTVQPFENLKNILAMFSFIFTTGERSFLRNLMALLSRL